MTVAVTSDIAVPARGRTRFRSLSSLSEKPCNSCLKHARKSQVTEIEPCVPCFWVETLHSLHWSGLKSWTKVWSTVQTHISQPDCASSPPDGIDVPARLMIPLLASSIYFDPHDVISVIDRDSKPIWACFKTPNEKVFTALLFLRIISFFGRLFLALKM